MLSSTGEMHVNGFQIAFDTYNSTISWQEKRIGEIWHWERVSPLVWCTCIQEDLNSKTDGPIKPKDTDTDTATTNPKDLVNITRKYVVCRLRLIEILTQKHGPGNINSQITV